MFLKVIDVLFILWYKKEKKEGKIMKFIHIADVHFDIPFTTLSSTIGAGEERRLDQRKAFKKVIQYCKDHKIEYLLIAGDLYEHEYIRESSIQYINELFQEIPSTKIYIAPGNHDPYMKNSYYETYKWNNNVTVIKPGIHLYQEPEFNLYAYGFGDFYCNQSGIETLEIKEKNKIHLLLMHANLDGAKKGEQEYNPILKSKLQEKGFDYIALGHIHKKSETANQDNIVYPGSLISLGFDELGKHGMVIGEITEENGKKKLKYEFIPVDEREFCEKEIDVSEKNSLEEIIEELNDIQDENNYYKIKLIGRRNFEIDQTKIRKNLIYKRILKIKDETKLKIDIEKESNQITLKGLFLKEAIQMERRRINQSRAV